MASRNFNRKQALEKEVKEIYASITIGSSGAPTLTSSVGVASISRTTNGEYVLTLQDTYVSLKMFECVLIKSSGEDITFQLKAESVASAKTVTFFTNTGATPTDPSSGAEIRLRLDLKNSTVA